MAINDSGSRDIDGEYSDWIEIHNPTEETVDLDGWFLTDKATNLDKWRFPAVSIEAGDYLVVRASERPRDNPLGELHTNFKLDNSGEYLALVYPDGKTISHEYAPAYPNQFEDVSYGVTQEMTTVVRDGTNLSYVVPDIEDAGLGTDWTEPDFNDADWTHHLMARPIVISEFSIGSPDWLEIQNVGNYAVDTTGWRVLFNEAADNDIQAINKTEWDLSGQIAIGEVLYCTDKANDPEFLGGDFNIWWSSSKNGWAMILDGQKNVVDFVAWGYGEAEIASTILDIGGTPVALGNAWSGPGITEYSSSLDNGTRRGDSDGNTAEDFVFLATDTQAALNPELKTPLAGGGDGPAPQTGVGFGEALNVFEDTVRTNVEGIMRDQNASLWMRIPFQIENAAALSGMQLRMKYEDGFVAYLNGRQVATRNAPGSPQWNSTAITDRPSSMAIHYETINLSQHVGLLRDGENLLAIHGLNDTAADGEFLILPELDVMEIALADAYMLQPTPGESNSEGIASRGPRISEVTENPPPPGADESLVITATLGETHEPLAGVELHYRVMFGAETTITMSDDGAGGDLVADDGIYTAMIPAAAYNRGEMVRWRVSAEDSQGDASREPAFLDTLGMNQSPEYFGTVAHDPAVTSDLPILHWFAKNPSSGRTRSGTRASVFFDGRFYDNMFVRKRGGATNGSSQKFNFSKGHDFYVNDELGYVGEFNLNAQGSDSSYLRQTLAFETFQNAGAEGCESFLTRVELNGSFDRVGVFIEQVDEDFLDRNGLDPDGALYKFVQRSNLNPVFHDTTTGIEKKTRTGEDLSDLKGLVTGLNLSSAEARRRFVFDNINLPQVTSYLALRSIVMDADDVRKNFYAYRDTNGTGEWSIFPWDMDWTFGIKGDGGTYLTHPFFGDYAHRKQNANQWNVLYNVMFNDPVFREMMLRRLRTLMDQLLQPPDTPTAERLFEARVDELVAPIRDHVGISSSTINSLKNYFSTRRQQLYVQHGIDRWTPTNGIAGIPHAQVGNPPIEFGTFEYAPASGNQDQEYIELVNPNSFAVDVSGWELTGGVRHTFRLGTVIPSNSSLYVSPDSAAFRARTVGPRGGQSLLVQDAYRGHLSSFGETVELVAADATLIDSFSYDGNPSATQEFLRISEIMYHPPEPTPVESGAGFTDQDNFEYLELTNIGQLPLDLEGVHFTDGIQFTFGPTAVQPGEFVLVVRNRAAFEARYGVGGDVAGEYLTQKLSDGGERIKLEDPLGGTIQEFTYNDKAPWPEEADGDGAGIEPVDLDGNYDSAANWHAGSEYLGSPGRESAEPLLGIVVNEVVAQSNEPDVDWFELLNTTTAAINISGWYVSDSGAELKKYQIPDGTILNPGQYLVLTEAQFNPAEPAAGQIVFALNSIEGDDVWLMETDGEGNLTRFADHADFGPSASGEAVGRWPNASGILYPMTVPTPGAANRGPRVGPIVLTEIMYHPPGPGGDADPDDFEFVEVHNPTSDSVDLTNWRIDGGVDFDFANGTILAAGATIVVVPFDATDAAKLDAFRNHYAMKSSALVVGGYSGKLDNGGERIELQRPGATVVPVPGDPPYLQRLLEDEVIYDDVMPWPAGPDGTGQSLSRVTAGFWGRDAASWDATTPTPGEFQSAIQFYPGDANLDGVTDVRDFMIWNVNKFTDGTTWEQGDFDLNGVTDVRDFMIWNAHKFTSASDPAPVLTQAVDDVLDNLWQLDESAQDTSDRTSGNGTWAQEAVDKLLATYWP